MSQNSKHDRLGSGSVSWLTKMSIELHPWGGDGGDSGGGGGAALATGGSTSSTVPCNGKVYISYVERREHCITFCWHFRHIRMMSRSFMIMRVSRLSSCRLEICTVLFYHSTRFVRIRIRLNNPSVLHYPTYGWCFTTSHILTSGNAIFCRCAVITITIIHIVVYGLAKPI